MQWLESAMTIIAFLSLMYGVICIDEHFQNNRSETKFLHQKEFNFETEKLFNKEMKR